MVITTELKLCSKVIPEQQDNAQPLDGHVGALLQLLGHDVSEDNSWESVYPVLQQDEVHEG